MVIVSCIAYNHKEYIEEAIQSFLSQKTTFRVEIWIHDDASTDGTTDIIRQYSEKFPDIIKPILQKTNKHSQKIKIRPTYHFPAANSNYIALCDGDDFWIHPLKLQHQFTFMEAHPDYSVCYHNSYLKNNHENLQTFISMNRTADFTISEAIAGLGGQTSSFFFRAEVTKILPAWVWNASTLDNILRIYLCLHGKSGYINKIFSVYRQNVPGSWNEKIKNKESKIAHRSKMVFALHLFNKETQFRYDQQVQTQIFESILKDLFWFRGQFNSLLPLIRCLGLKTQWKLIKKIFGIKLKTIILNTSPYKKYTYLRNPLRFSLDKKWKSDSRMLPLTEDNKDLYYRIHHIYFVVFQRFPDLIECKEFSEKIQWLKLFDQDKRIIQLADKITVRDYVAEIVGPEILPKVYQICESYENIQFDLLPDSFVLKTNNDCGTVVLVKNKSEFIDWEAREKLTKSLKRRYGWNLGEWAYAFIPPKILIEEYLSDDHCESPPDFNFFVIEGKVRIVRYTYDRNSCIQYQIIDRTGKDLNSVLIKNASNYSDKFQKPDQWEEMIEIAEMLSASFKFIRIDLYLVKSKIYFGELKFWVGAEILERVINNRLIGLDEFDRTTFKATVVKDLKNKIVPPGSNTNLNMT